MASITAAFALRASTSRNSSPSVSGGLTSSHVRPPSVVRNTRPGPPSVALPPVTHAVRRSTASRPRKLWSPSMTVCLHDSVRSLPWPRVPWWPEPAAVVTFSAYAALPRSEPARSIVDSTTVRTRGISAPCSCPDGPVQRVPPCAYPADVRSAGEPVESCFEACDGAFDIGELVEAEESDPEGGEVVAFTAPERHPGGCLKTHLLELRAAADLWI